MRVISEDDIFSVSKFRSEKASRVLWKHLKYNDKKSRTCRQKWSSVITKEQAVDIFEIKVKKPGINVRYSDIHMYSLISTIYSGYERTVRCTSRMKSWSPFSLQGSSKYSCIRTYVENITSRPEDTLPFYSSYNGNKRGFLANMMAYTEKCN